MADGIGRGTACGRAVRTIRPTGLVVIVSPGGRSAGGGMGTVSRLIADSLDRSGSGLEAVILDSRGAGRAVLWPLFFLDAAVRLLGAAARRRVEILHLQVSERSSFLRKGLLLRLGRAFGIATVLHHHGAELIPTYRTGSVAMRRLVRATVRSADANVVLGEVWRRFLVDEVGADPSRVTVLRNASFDLGGALSSDALAIGESPDHLLLLANLSPRKGVSEFLRALALLRRRGRSILATLAGGGEVERYEEEAAREGVADLCRFTGWVDYAAVEALFRDAAVLVLPSYDEGLPMSILEALSARVPVVATPVGSIPEVLTSGEDCLLVPPGDVEALAAAIERVLADPALRTSLIERGRSLYERDFEPRSFAEHLLQIYDEARITRAAARRPRLR